MSIPLTCQCGRRYAVKDTLAGKRVKCPACQTALLVPLLEVTAPQEVGEYQFAEPATASPFPFDLAAAAASVQAAPAAAATPAATANASADGHSSPSYFLAGHDRVFSTAKLFRAYPDGDSVLFVFAGPFHRSMIEGYRAQQAQLMGRGAMAGLSAGASGAAVGAGAAAAGAAIDWIASKFHQSAVAERAKKLDPMNLEMLRTEVDTDKQSFRLNRQTVEKATIERPKESFWSVDENGELLSAYLRFKHKTTGQWHFQIMSDADRDFAIESIRRCLGEKLTVQLS